MCSRACFLVGGLPPRTCFYVGGLLRPGGSRSCFYVWATAIRPNRGQHRIDFIFASAAAAMRLNCGRPHVKTRVGAARSRKRRHVKTRTGREAAHEKTRTGASWSWHDQNCKMLPCVFSRGRPSAPYVFSRVDVFEESASRSCFYEWTRWGSAGVGPKIFKKILNPETRIYD